MVKKQLFGIFALLLPSYVCADHHLEPILKIRPRVETVDDGKVDADEDGKDDTKNANALTTRTTLGVKAKDLFSVSGLRFHGEAMHVSTLAADYNSSSAVGANSEYATVIDPPITRLVQGYLSYTFGETSITVGRKLLALDNHRFIGTVGWRQMPQSFGVYEIRTKEIPGLDLQLDYVYERLGIKDELSGLYNEGTVLAHMTYTVADYLKINLYDYLIQNTHDTMGTKLFGKFGGTSYGVTYAVQKKPSRKIKDYESPKINTYFYEVDVSQKIGPLALGLNYHILGEAKEEDDGKGFSTPLATLHKWEGWSDVLLGKAAGGDAKGLKATSASVKYKHDLLGMALIAYHQFTSVKDSLDYGSEIDILYKKKINDKLMTLLKAALYSKGDDFAANDVKKMWLMAEYTF